ncbi:hypothetical protein [Pontibacter pamirensis]|nr:hypothetical protein [Pontibacter pamirensis]
MTTESPALTPEAGTAPGFLFEVNFLLLFRTSLSESHLPGTS